MKFKTIKKSGVHVTIEVNGELQEVQIITVEEAARKKKVQLTSIYRALEDNRKTKDGSLLDYCCPFNSKGKKPTKYVVMNEKWRRYLKG